MKRCDCKERKASPAPTPCSTDPLSLPEDVRRKLLACRDALIECDYDEAFHQLYLIADPNTEKLDPWARIEGR